MSTRCPVYHDPQLDLIAALREANALLARDYATLRSDYACFVEITLGLAEEEQK